MPIPFRPHVQCKRCRRPFLKNRVDKVYCSVFCQNPTLLQNPTVNRSLGTFRSLATLDQTPNLHELAGIFERETGVPFTISLTHLPKKRYQLPEIEPREEQGQVWWNARPEPADEPEPNDIECLLRAQMPVPGPYRGETVEEWKAKGNIIKPLPPGTALAF